MKNLKIVSDNDLKDWAKEIFEKNSFKMIDVSEKKETFRRALASGKIYVGDEVFELIKNKGVEVNIKTDFFQSNIEGNIVSKIQESSNYDYIVINPAAFTHTSIAIRDALLAVNIEFYEVHISNIYQREEFRHKSYINDIAKLSFIGDGLDGYKKALASAALTREVTIAVFISIWVLVILGAIKNFKEDWYGY